MEQRGGNARSWRGYQRAAPYGHFNGQRGRPQEGSAGHPSNPGTGGPGPLQSWRNARHRGGMRGGRGGRGGGRGDTRQNQQKKREKEENFYCCSCDRGFQTQEQLDQHNEEHVVCGLEGCTFEAHSLVVTKHIRIQHDGNLFRRLKHLKTPEDIQAWRAERKKNYPKSSVEEEETPSSSSSWQKPKPGPQKRKGKGAHPTVAATTFRYRIQPDDERGHSYAQYERRMRQLEHEQGDGWMRRPFAPDINQRNKKVPFFSMNQSKLVNLESFYLNVAREKESGKVLKKNKVRWQRFQTKVLDSLTDSESEGDPDEIPISDSEDEDKEEEKGAAGGGGGLMLVNYCSSSDSEPEAETEKEQTSAAKPAETVATEANNEDDSDDGMVIEEFKKDATFKEKPIFKKPKNCTRKKWLRTKLLETLLQDQIRKERNILLQACQFIRQNNFFDPVK